jgi:hypothetical protein
MKYYAELSGREIIRPANNKKRTKANRNGHILRRNCFLTHVTGRKIEEQIEVTGR